MDYYNNGWLKRKLEIQKLGAFPQPQVNFLYFVPKRIRYKRNKYLYKSLQRSYLRTRAEKKNWKIRFEYGWAGYGEMDPYLYGIGIFINYYIFSNKTFH